MSDKKKGKLGLGKMMGATKKKLTGSKKSITRTTESSYTPAVPPPVGPRRPQPLFDQQSLVRFRSTFQNVTDDLLIAEFWCKALSGDVVLEGTIYITKFFLGFTAPFNNQRITVVIPYTKILDVKRAVPEVNPNSTTPSFRMIFSPDSQATCLQVFTSDYLKHTLFDCKLVASFEAWYSLVTENWQGNQA